MHFVILQVLYSQGIIISGHMTSMVPTVTNRHNAAFPMATVGDNPPSCFYATLQ